MPYQTLIDYNITSGTDRIFLFVASNMPLFVPLFLTFLYFIIAITIYSISRTKNQNADFFGGMAVAGIFILVIATLLNFVPGVMNLLTDTYIAIVAAISLVLFYFSRRTYS